MAEKFIHYFLSCLLILVIFAVVHIVHFRILKPEVVLKACIIDIVISCFVGSLLYLMLLKNDVFVIFSALVTMTLGLAIYAILVPTMVDRSLSVYMLVYLDESVDGSLTKDQLKNMLINETILEKRIAEHERAGAISVDGEKITLTKKGRLASKIFMYDLEVLALKRNF